MRCGAPLLFLILATTQAAWVLETNVDYITPSETKDVQLVCKPDSKVENDKGIQTINGIRIMKLDPFGNKNVFAEIHVLTNQPSSTEKNVQVAANLKRGNVAFLKATWPVADDETEGAYGCEISGYDTLDNSVIIHARPGVQLKRKMLTESDVIDLIQKMTESHVKKQKDLEKENDALRKFIAENLQSTRQIIRNKGSEVTTILSNLKNTIESTYSTKSELKDQVSELKDFTINRILADKSQSQKQFDALSSLVKNASSTIDERVSETGKSLSSLKAQFDSTINSLRGKDKEILSHMTSSISILTTKINLIDTKYERLKRQLTSDFTTKISYLEQKCPCTRPPAPITAMPKPTLPKSIISNWPAGDYALVRPETGCPNLRALKTAGRSLFKTLPYDGALNVWSQTFGKDSSVPTNINLIISSDSRMTELKYCEKNTSIPSPSFSPWPKGTYCIAKVGATCPPAFTDGSIRYLIRNIGTANLIGDYTMEHCCRSDEYPDVPAKLPTEAPFYLYRFKGSCQKVEGMTVRDGDLLQLKTLGSKKVEKLKLDTPHADLAGSWPFLALCHYQPS